jgi:hypothetical protein
MGATFFRVWFAGGEKFFWSFLQGKISVAGTGDEGSRGKDWVVFFSDGDSSV